MSNSDRFARTCPEGHPTVEVHRDGEWRWLHCTTCLYVSEPWQEFAPLMPEGEGFMDV
jgi:hypothetical protein